MLRSLVGSEMCIRDRVWGQQWVGDPRTLDVHIRWLREKLEEHPAQPKLCLLYTSDAADDLLCVDLGGRRIIKKKIILISLSIPTRIT